MLNLSVFIWLEIMTIKLGYELNLVIRLGHLLTYTLTQDVSIVLLFARIVQISIEIQHLAPSDVDLMDVSLHLFTHIDKLLPSYCVINHYNTSCLPKRLISKIRRFISKVVDFTCLLRKHYFEGLFSIICHLNRVINLRLRNLPLS